MGSRFSEGERLDAELGEARRGEIGPDLQAVVPTGEEEVRM
jgi:hypothetical protein